MLDCMIKDLKTEIWVSALIKRAQIGGASAFVVHKGDRDVGSVLIKISTLDGNARLVAPSRNMDGALIWVDLSQTIVKRPLDEIGLERQIDEYMQKRLSQDRDLWLIEIEDKLGRDFLIEKVE